MNKQNQLRHSAAVVRRFLNNPDVDRIGKIHNAITDYCDFGYVCDRCAQDDFGYCGLRRSDISDLDRVTKYCFPAFLKYADKEKTRFLEGKGHE